MASGALPGSNRIKSATSSSEEDSEGVVIVDELVGDDN